ncbi:MAG: ammonia-forming cytochrome c nitrite reductase subunit c552, partial [bacterium]
PYRREGAMKISDHQVRSPLLNINGACQGCHRASEAELKDRVETIQSRFSAARDLALDALVELIADIRAARDAGASDADLAQARAFQRKAQFYIDYVEAENSTGFHAPGEALRILTDATDSVRRGQLAVRRIQTRSAQAR